MSPHAVPVASLHGRPSVDLSEFGVSKNAFLPEHNPPERLSDPYYEPWEAIVSQLPALIESGAIRRHIGLLPVLSTAQLQSEPEWQRAYAMLAFMTHAHIWGGDAPEEILPPQLTVPFLRVSEHLELPPVLTYAAANLWNFACAGDDFSKIENLRTLFSFTGTVSESWFLLISAAMEAKAAGVLHTVTAALMAVKAREYGLVADALDELRRCIDDVAALLERMHEHCDPAVFYHQIRPFLAGSKNMEAAGLPRGVFYDEGDGRGSWRQLRGGSNGQSSLIQFFDVVLGVEHRGHGNADDGAAASCASASASASVTATAGQTTPSFHAEVRDYMPGPHRRFLVHAARMGSIRELVLASASASTAEGDGLDNDDDRRRLREAYVAATRALSSFRDKHIQIVARYIVLPSKQAAAQAGSSPVENRPDPEGRSCRRQNLASSSSSRQADDDLTGTGGTKLVPFLKMARDETRQAGFLVRPRRAT
ncbi:hypothetical protein CDD83_10138 [Cordyceps sp. RAO-2017]|nr:hypothetical protein CDD83_10138 [Cordyceps sp. RAO-2017]